MFKKAIQIILSEPPDLHYPSYYADLLSEADIPDKNVGKCSEIPNSSDCISRQAAILQLSHNKCGNDENDIAVQHDIETIRKLPPVESEQKIGYWIPVHPPYKRMTKGLIFVLIVIQEIGI